MRQLHHSSLKYTRTNVRDYNAMENFERLGIVKAYIPSVRGHFSL